MSRSPSPSRSPSQSPDRKDPNAVDRQKTTPFLLHLTYRTSAFHNLTDFPIPTPSNPRPPLPAHLQIYTWMSCSLRELAHLLTSALPGIIPDPAIGTRLSFRLVFPDTSSGGRGGRLDEGRGRYTSKEMGSVVIAASQGHDRTANGAGSNWELGGDDSAKTLADSRFVIGDYIDCAVFPPLPDGSAIPRARVNGYGGSGRGRGGMTRGAPIPSGEWRRGERLPGGADSGYRGRGGGGGGSYRRAPY